MYPHRIVPTHRYLPPKPPRPDPPKPPPPYRHTPYRPRRRLVITGLIQFAITALIVTALAYFGYLVIDTDPDPTVAGFRFVSTTTTTTTATAPGFFDRSHAEPNTVWYYGHQSFPSLLARYLAEADYLDTIADLLLMDPSDQYAEGDPEGSMDGFLDHGQGHCSQLQNYSRQSYKPDTRNDYISHLLDDVQNLFLKGQLARSIAAAIEHLCPQHNDLLQSPTVD